MINLMSQVAGQRQPAGGLVTPGSGKASILGHEIDGSGPKQLSTIV